MVVQWLQSWRQCTEAIVPVLVDLVADSSSWSYCFVTQFGGTYNLLFHDIPTFISLNSVLIDYLASVLDTFLTYVSHAVN